MEFGLRHLPVRSQSLQRTLVVRSAWRARRGDGASPATIARRLGGGDDRRSGGGRASPPVRRGAAEAVARTGIVHPLVPSSGPSRDPTERCSPAPPLLPPPPPLDAPSSSPILDCEAMTMQMAMACPASRGSGVPTSRAMARASRIAERSNRPHQSSHRAKIFSSRGSVGDGGRLAVDLESAVNVATGRGRGLGLALAGGGWFATVAGPGMPPSPRSLTACDDCLTRGPFDDGAMWFMMARRYSAAQGVRRSAAGFLVARPQPTAHPQGLSMAPR